MIRPSRVNNGCSMSRGAHVMILINRGSGGGRSGEMARSSGISENVDEKDRRSAVKGGG